ncbi:C-type lectin domain family 4 member E-like [Engraulis encrasicolus]|uniref:C-type lectin domain family 4 member E-like n=1 Tax=Engraulis encrasicolus TaxID=184585 RepID=UPI002FD4ADDC
MSTIEQVELNEDIYANNGDESQRRDDLDEEQVDPDLQGGFTTQNGKDKFTSDWKSFGSSRYYISSDERNWADSKQHCMDLGGDLVIIDSQEEQEFINTQIKSIYAETRAWIGLSDLETEGVWKWVDGKPLSKFGFWMQDEPNDDKGAEDCVETLYQYNPLKTWNDAICSMDKHCICEINLT